MAPKKDKKNKRDSGRENMPPRILICPFCQTNTVPNYKTWEDTARFVSDRGKILPRSRTGICAKHQRILSKAIKRARHLALLPFTIRPL